METMPVAEIKKAKLEEMLRTIIRFLKSKSLKRDGLRA
jgi:hypothetical protein